MSWPAMSAQEQGGGQAPAGGRGGAGAGPGRATVESPGRATGSPGFTNGAPGGTPVAQNKWVQRELQNEGMSSNPVRYLQTLLGSYGPINLGNQYPNPYKRIEPWGELPANYEGRMPSPIGAEMGPDGNVYTLLRCRNNSCNGQPQDPIVVWDLQGKLVRAFGAKMYQGPHGMAVDKDGNVWTADQNNHLVRKWSQDGKLLLSIGTEGKSDPNGVANVLFQPTDVVVDADGFVYITNSHAKMGPRAFVAKYDGSGKFVKILAQGPTGGSGPGQLDEPHSIAIDIRGRLFISDRSNNRVQIWDREGNYIHEYRQFSRPSGIFIAADDRMWVFDSESYGPDNPAWQKGFREGNALTGVVSYYAMDIESRDYVHSGPEGGGVDSQGNVYACVVRRMQMERHEPPKPIPTRNAAWGPYVQHAGAMPAGGPTPYPKPSAAWYISSVGRGGGGE
jgi:sugar lactone lactonase YvrE